MPKRLLIITYYWPPAGGSGVQRWLKFAKYLREFGWEPVIYTAENPEAPAYDSKLVNEVPSGIEVMRRKVWEPYNLFRLVTGAKGQKFGAGLASVGKQKKGFLGKTAIWIRGNFFIPDARMFWIRPSVKFLSKYLRNNPVDAIVSTGPPHSTHLIARRVSKKAATPWLADFRDPWTNIDFFDELMPSRLATAIHKRLEKKVLTQATKVVTVTNGWANDFSKLANVHIDVVQNGFDPEDFESVKVTFDTDFTLTHIGTLSPNRNCNMLWQVLGKWVKSNPLFAKHFRLKFVGSVDSTAYNAIEANGLLPFSEFFGYLPHAEAIKMQMQSAVLLLLVNNSPNALGIQTGKVFEYMAAKRPILAIGPAGGNTHDLIEETKSGVFADFSSPKEVEKGIEVIWEMYQNKFVGFEPEGFAKYSRKTLTQRFARILDAMVSK